MAPAGVCRCQRLRTACARYAAVEVRAAYASVCRDAFYAARMSICATRCLLRYGQLVVSWRHRRAAYARHDEVLRRAGAHTRGFAPAKMPSWLFALRDAAMSTAAMPVTPVCLMPRAAHATLTVSLPAHCHARAITADYAATRFMFLRDGRHAIRR